MKIVNIDGVNIHYGDEMKRELHLPTGMNGEQLRKWLDKNQAEMDKLTKTLTGKL